MPIVAAIGAILCATQACYHHKPEVHIWRDFGFAPLNILFMPELLTPTGRKYRAASFFFLVLYVASVMVLSRMGS